MKKRVLCLAAILASVLFLFSCSRKDNKKDTGSKKEDSTKTIIGFSIDTLAIERWQRDLDIFINKAKELGAEVIVQNAGNDLEEQKRQIRYLIDKKVSALVILPKEAKGLTDVVDEAKSKGIPVISYDRLMLNTSVDLYVTINSQKVGEYMATGFLTKTQARKFFAILGAEEDFNMALVKEGIVQKLQKVNKKLDYIYYTSGWNYDLANNQMINLINQNKIPDAIFCGNDAVGDSVIQALKLFNLDGKIYVCGQDADIAACQNIIQGKQLFTIYKPITELASLAAECAVKLARDEKIGSANYKVEKINNGITYVPVIWLDPILVDKTNLDSVIIDSGFHRRNEVYRE